MHWARAAGHSNDKLTRLVGQEITLQRHIAKKKKKKKIRDVENHVKTRQEMLKVANVWKHFIINVHDFNYARVRSRETSFWF